MKFKFLSIALLFVTNLAFSQSYMNDIVIGACECIESLSEKSDVTEVELGLCLIEAASPYAKQLKKDYKIDMYNMDESVGMELGQVIGVKMAGVCPDLLIKMADIVEESSNESGDEYFFYGQVVSIDDSKFVEFSVKDASGKISKFYWLNFVESNVELTNDYKTLLNENVHISFSSQEFFDPRIAEYRAINVIQTIDLEEE
jgi:hypothetical protein